MINNFEYRIFYEELKRLHKEYQRCESAILKQSISKDIELIEDALETI
jgi:predicted DNA-binding protein